jgi:hypothetical protein
MTGKAGRGDNQRFAVALRKTHFSDQGCDKLIASKDKTTYAAATPIATVIQNMNARLFLTQF